MKPMNHMSVEPPLPYRLTLRVATESGIRHPVSLVRGYFYYNWVQPLFSNRSNSYGAASSPLRADYGKRFLYGHRLPLPSSFCHAVLVPTDLSI